MDFKDDYINCFFVHSLDLSGRIIWANSIQDLVPKMAKEYGTQPVLPDWIMTGATMGLEGIDGGTAEVKSLTKQNQIQLLLIDFSSL